MKLRRNLILLNLAFPFEIVLTFVFSFVVWVGAYVCILIPWLQVGVGAEFRAADAHVARIRRDARRALLAATLRVPSCLVLFADRLLGNTWNMEAVRLSWLRSLVFLRIRVSRGVFPFCRPILVAALYPTLIKFTVVNVIAIIFGCSESINYTFYSYLSWF